MKDIIIQVLLVFFMLTTGLYACRYYKCKSKEIPKLTGSIQIDSVGTMVTPIESHRNSDSINYVTIDTRTNSIIEKEATKKAAELAPVIHDLAENLSVQPKQIESGLTVSTKAFEDSINFLRKQLVDAQKLTYYYKDKYLTLTVRTNNNTDTTDRGSFDFAYDADLNIVQYWKRKHFFSTKESYTVISSNDPRVTISGVKKFTVVQKQPELGFRAGLRASYNTNTTAIGVGPYLRTDINKWTIDASYLYNTQTKKTGVVIGLNRDLIRF